MKKLFLTIVAALTVSLAAQADNPYKKFTEKLPFAMPEVSAPVIPDNEVKLSDFGAVGDGIALNTEAFRKAIDALSQKGGGKLVVPQGVWHTGPIVLKSNIELHLKAGAVILFAADESLYPIIETSFEGLDTRRLQSPIYANGATNIAITGKGVIDGNGQYWRPVKKEKVTAKHWKSLLAIPGSQELKPGYWVPSAGYAQGEKGANMGVECHQAFLASCHDFSCQVQERHAQGCHLPELSCLEPSSVDVRERHHRPSVGAQSQLCSEWRCPRP